MFFEEEEEEEMERHLGRMLHSFFRLLLLLLLLLLEEADFFCLLFGRADWFICCVLTRRPIVSSVCRHSGRLKTKKRKQKNDHQRHEKTNPKKTKENRHFFFAFQIRPKKKRPDQEKKTGFQSFDRASIGLQSTEMEDKNSVKLGKTR